MKSISLRDFPDASSRRQALSQTLNTSLENVGQFNFAEEQVQNKNIENLIGAVSIPLGVAGPLLVNKKEHFLPLATTEGALVASISRGAKAIAESGGASVFVEDVGMTRGPVFETQDLYAAHQLKKWLEENFKILKKVCEKTSDFLTLKTIHSQVLGNNLYCRFVFDTKDAMGMNMATIAAQAGVTLIEQKTKAKCLSIAGNFDIDKKAAFLNFIEGRGKKVWAEVILKKTVVKNVLKIDSKDLNNLVYKKCQLGSALSGALGFNAHFANIISAMYIATGQDPSHVVEGSLGITTSELKANGDLNFSVYLPAVLVGIVGGGTTLPTQKEALSLLKVKSSVEFAQVLGGAVLAGEISLLASQAEGSLAKAHQKLGRGKK